MLNLQHRQQLLQCVKRANEVEREVLLAQLACEEANDNVRQTKILAEQMLLVAEQQHQQAKLKKEEKEDEARRLRVPKQEALAQLLEELYGKGQSRSSRSINPQDGVDSGMTVSGCGVGEMPLNYRPGDVSLLGNLPGKGGSKRSCVSQSEFASLQGKHTDNVGGVEGGINSQAESTDVASDSETESESIADAATVAVGGNSGRVNGDIECQNGEGMRKKSCKNNQLETTK
eukprot:CAMPEP_0202444506 /NCGR_PEP_ID=MMETSP1360-20130828/3561_1 /ASSEMBLY_ACC=CAM_ASM_000848 /TAXON_ID=515479 /ORGANISM="Licmophora paradoxa, Strain CCMP2313" /LENGTH=230 /DNA_ID=CAMNT_0049060523 /DNA_START=513 /DNA_END=1205 /DNA_ORIENTATION=-